MRKNRAFTIMELVIVAAVVLCMIGILTPFVQMTKARANRLHCANNLRQISLCLHRYALDHNNAFPKNLEDLYPNYTTEQISFDDYTYVTGLTEASSPKEIIVQDKESNHKKRGKHVLRIDGAVEWVREKR